MAHNIERLDGQPVLRVAARSGSDAELKAWLVANGESEAGVINDPLGAVAAAWGVNAYPTTFAVASDGEIVSSTVGYATELGLRARLWLAG